MRVRQRVSRAHARLALLVLLTALCAGCAKTVKWEEEVLLNTGETIWVSKKVRYSIKGQPGNPLDLSYLPDQVETIRFKYGQKSFVYTGEAKIQVLAISPTGIPVLLAKPTSNDWYRHNNYPCVHPYYVQLVPDDTGQNWSWPERIERWTYNLQSNLLVDRDSPSSMRSRYRMYEKADQSFFHDPQLLDFRLINPNYIADVCKRSK